MTSISFSDVGMGPQGTVLLSTMLKSPKMIAAITSFDISRNPGIVAKLDEIGQAQQVDCNLTELKQLLDAIEQLEKLQNLNIGEIGTEEQEEEQEEGEV